MKLYAKNNILKGFIKFKLYSTKLYSTYLEADGKDVWHGVVAVKQPLRDVVRRLLGATDVPRRDMHVQRPVLDELGLALLSHEQVIVLRVCREWE